MNDTIYIVMEVLSCLRSKVEQRAFINGFRVEGRTWEGIYASHPIFVDDAFFFLVFLMKLTHISWNGGCGLYFVFEVVLKLKINLQKGELIPIRELVKVGKLLASLFGWHYDDSG